MKCRVWWSIYVRTKFEYKLRERHLPPINAALGDLEFAWDVISENESPDLLRLINYQNLEAETSSGIILPVIERAYKLANGWTILGLSQLSEDNLTHVMGTWAAKKPTSAAPALESMIFEIEPGHIGGMTDEGGWFPRDDQ